MLASGTNTATLVSFIDQKSQLFSVGLTELPPPTSLLRGARTLLWRSTPIWRTFRRKRFLTTPDWSCERLKSTSVWHFLSNSESFFAVFEHDGRADKVLLAFAPLIDNEVTDHSAVSHVKFLEGILPFSIATLPTSFNS
ncbi:hypothetical protein JG687_00017412 [Phytophthora cactorum]|uniref:Uncharacterized protein n=1 Tax=Phytophthora cactorum TaxID=29920 RepID=A0A8T1TPF6_9STRA|nr:hypothetical protein JG687_00017412 [Phytophthora cactorum]